MRMDTVNQLVLNVGVAIVKYRCNDVEVDETKEVYKPNLSARNTEDTYANKEESKKAEEHLCEVDGCNKAGKNKMVGVSGDYEYYCQQHYDEIMKVVDSMETDVAGGNASKHICEVSGCRKEGTNGIKGVSGNIEYYCTEHYNEMNRLLENMLQ